MFFLFLDNLKGKGEVRDDFCAIFVESGILPQVKCTQEKVQLQLLQSVGICVRSFLARFFDVSLHLPSVFFPTNHPPSYLNWYWPGTISISIAFNFERTDVIFWNHLVRLTRAFCTVTTGAVPGDFESHHRIDQLVLHVQGPIEPAVMKGLRVNILIVYVGSWGLEG